MPAIANMKGLTRIVKSGQYEFPVVVAGEGPAVLLLHGFPDSRLMWRFQVPALTQAGFTVIAPDLRGFGEAPRPEGKENYLMPLILADLNGILDTLSTESVSVIAHDWGAGAAWMYAAFFPERVERLAALSVGCPWTSGWTTFEQREASWYILFFQWAGIAEARLMENDWELFKGWMRGRGDVDLVLEQIQRPGALTAALNWYRANAELRMPAEDPPNPAPIACPVMGLWSDGDVYLTEGQMLSTPEALSGDWRYEKIEGASHWMMLEKSEQTNELLIDFLKS